MSTLHAPDPVTADTTVSVPFPLWDQRLARPFTQQDRDTIVTMAVLGYTMREVAEELGRTKNSLAVYCHHNKISFVRLRKLGRNFS